MQLLVQVKKEEHCRQKQKVQGNILPYLADGKS